jgi:heat shock protein HtpX
MRLLFAVAMNPSGGLNAFATGRNPKHAAVAATEGLVQALSREELTGVMAHELSHVQNRDILIGTIAAAIAGAISMIANMAQWGMIFGGFGGRRDDERGGGFATIIMIITIRNCRSPRRRSARTRR